MKMILFHNVILIQFYCSSNQEIFDTVIQAFKLGEDSKVSLPVMINYNAFILSHTSMPVTIPDQKEIDDFLPKYNPVWKLDVNNPITFGNIILPPAYEKIRKDMQNSQEKSKKATMAAPTAAIPWAALLLMRLSIISKKIISYLYFTMYLFIVQMPD